MIRRYIIWRNSHAYDERLRRAVARANPLPDAARDGVRFAQLTGLARRYHHEM